MKTQKRIFRIKSILVSLIIALFFLPSAIYADWARISQVDPSTLMFNQKVKLYVSITDETGGIVKDLKKENFTVYESPDGTTFNKIPQIDGFKTMANYESGINFLLLIDNSGSMYYGMTDQGGVRDTRIGHAKKAITAFLNSVDNPNDRVGLASYNSYYTSYSKPIADVSLIKEHLEDIVKPVGAEGYTEMYASLSQAVEEFKSVKGRKVIIILSDGANRSYFRYTKKSNRDFGDKIYTYTEPITYCQKEGISVFAINYGTSRYRKDRRLKDISRETGGAIFDAKNSTELRSVYSTIVNQVLNEYYIVYKATMVPADKKFVKVEYKSGDEERSATRFYFASMVFGVPFKELSPLLLLPLLLAFLLLWLLSKLKFEKSPGDASLELLNAGSAKAVTRLVSLNNKGKTVIGSSGNADMTIVGGLTGVEENHATVAFDDKSKKYTLTSEEGTKVNNRRVKTKILNSGDVINVEGTTIVFDDGKV
ncbi:MAG: VWA domain-containing protein [bacterium]|nr:VWA domain-containing protein [bacterium]